MRWKEASTVIIAAKSKTNEQYQILSLQRSEKSSFLPNVHVFPGGLVDEADSSVEWLKVFKLNFHNLVNLERIDFNMCNPIHHNANIYKLKYQNHTDNQNFVNLKEFYQKPSISQLSLENKVLPKCISLRITAIREAFEECGILLCKPNRTNREEKKENEENSASQSPLPTSSTQQPPITSSNFYMKNYFHFEHLTEWRQRVYNNPLEFVNLCLLLDCHPDLNNVHIWSNWLAPGRLFTNVRHDSKFFLVMFDDVELPKCAIDHNEMKSLQWTTPEQLIQDSMDGKLWLPPPQFYECSRLLNYRTLSELNAFLLARDSSRCEQWLPVRVNAKDGEIGLFPGDWMYPPDGFDVTSTEYYKDHSELTMTQLQTYGHESFDTSKLPHSADTSSEHSSQSSSSLPPSNISSSESSSKLNKSDLVSPSCSSHEHSSLSSSNLPQGVSKLPLNRMQYSRPFRFELIVDNLPPSGCLPIARTQRRPRRSSSSSSTTSSGLESKL
uniref:Nucleoside diphosphate-linked moiety X motif 19 n=1 Tax=Cacopsylla melanoneura TaxID=428564 RepID=A0A8D8UIR8_9HEMI